MAPFLKSESETTTVLLQGAVRLLHEEFEQEQDFNRVRVPIVNKTKIANGIFEFHSPSTVSRVTDIKIGRSWW